jgi:geranylgeranyl pyrophosphate synthase
MRSLLAGLRPTEASSASPEAPQAASRLEARFEVAPEAVAKVIARSVELGAVEESRRDVERFTARARREIARLPRGSSRDRLEGLAERLLNRQY